MSELGKITYFFEKSNSSRVSGGFLSRALNFQSDENSKKEGFLNKKTGAF
jgi:hypothetical protein